MRLSTHLILEPGEWNRDLLPQYTIPNPLYEKNKRLGYSNYGVPPTLRLYKIKDGCLYVPRNKPPSFENTTPIPFLDYKDERVNGHKVSFPDKITLREDQIPAVRALSQVNDGILNAGCGKGKTVMFLKAMAGTGVTTLVLVHKEFLMTQWIKSAVDILGMDRKDIGTCQGSFDNWRWKGKKLVIGMLQSIHANIDRLPHGFPEYFGLVGADECHRMSAPTFNEVITSFPAKRRWGLTATLNRSDGLESIFLAHIGNVVYRLLGTNLKPVVHRVKTGVQMDLKAFTSRGNLSLTKMVTALTYDEDRNRQILRLLVKAAEAGRRILVLTERREHAAFLKESFDLNTSGFETRLYLGGMTPAEREDAEENADVLFGSYQMAKEGLDIPSLDTLFLATPVGSEITVEQSLGRISREYPGKKNPMVVDFVDELIRPFVGLHNKRYRVYQKMGVEIR